MSIIELDEVSKRFAGVDAVKDLSFSIGQGEVIGLLGHNGAGKTTTMKMILGLEAATSGNVRVLGCDPQTSAFQQAKYQIGFLPENVAFYGQLTGREVLAYFAKLKKVEKSRVLELLEQVGLAYACDRKVKTYSKGMKQRLGLAQALLQEPGVLLLDEPTVGLDPIATQDFYALIDELRQKGTTVMLCSHVLPGIEKHIDRVLILSGGELQAQGTIAELRQKAGLPSLIRLNGLGSQETVRDGLLARLPALTMQPEVRLVNCSELEILVSAEDKPSVLTHLMVVCQGSSQTFQDIEIQSPSLEQLYRHFIHADRKTSFGRHP